MDKQDIRMEQPRKKHLSMVRSYTIADLFTLGNASCGTISLFLCLNYIAEGRNKFFWIAFVLLFIALACDIMDGYWARRSRRQSVLGADLDSLADIVSFGVCMGRTKNHPPFSTDHEPPAVTLVSTPVSAVQ
jgi:CDP-diacylglycerol--serine O-phosphatidyltransferase